jgi:hypothetical protein
MNKKIVGAQQGELVWLRDWSLVIANFIVKNSNGFASPQEAADLYQMLTGAINEAFQKNNLKGLKTICAELNEIAKGGSAKEIYDLNELLMSKFGENLNNYKIDNIKKVKRLLKKGKIEREDDFRLVQNRLEDIYDDDSKREEAEGLDALLSTYTPK